MIGSVTKVQSHDEGKGGRSVTEVHGSVMRVRNKSTTDSMENERARKCNGGMASQFTRIYDVFLYVRITN